MHIIGLTGGIASGKSTVSRMLAELGAHIIDADKIAKEITEPSQPAWNEIVEIFGKAILLPNGKNIDRRKLGNIVFSNEHERKKLERVTHKWIEEKMYFMIDEAKKQGYDIVILDIPLLFEAKWDEVVDEIWVVYVCDEKQLIRLMQRNGYDENHAKQRITAQLSLDEKARLADFIIDNNYDIENTRRQVHEKWNQVVNTFNSNK